MVIFFSIASHLLTTIIMARPAFMRKPAVLILFPNASFSIQDHQDDITIIDGFQRATEYFFVFSYTFTALTHPSSIHHDEFITFRCKTRIDGVTRVAFNIRHNHRSSPKMALIIEDLPTFGGPMILEAEWPHHLLVRLLRLGNS